MLPKGLYELMPYLYMSAGALAILLYGGVSTPLAMLLYLFGAWLWSLRSRHRRRSPPTPQKPRSGWFWSETLYELLPFIYILAGVFVLDQLQHGIRLVSGPLIIATGLLLIIVRHCERRKRPRVMPTPNTDPVDRLINVSQTALWPELANVVMENSRIQLELAPSQLKCEQCGIRDICAGVELKTETISELMRLSQTLVPEQSYPLFLRAAERIERRRLFEPELMPVLKKLHAYATLCATWRSTGRHSA
ncbi:MAG TPA: hypothetical protein VIS52_01500 [Motiliproteus sp.]